VLNAARLVPDLVSELAIEQERRGPVAPHRELVRQRARPRRPGVADDHARRAGERTDFVAEDLTGLGIATEARHVQHTERQTLLDPVSVADEVRVALELLDAVRVLRVDQRRRPAEPAALHVDSVELQLHALVAELAY